MRTGSVSMMTLLLAMTECYADFVYKVVENLCLQGLLDQECTRYSPNFSREGCNKNLPASVLAAADS